MSSLVFNCDCGNGAFLSSIDNRSYVAHLIPDQEYDTFSGIVDAAIERSAPTLRDKDAACMAWRAFQMPKAWQCPSCGSLYVEARDGERHRFLPASESTSKQLFKRR